MNIAEYIKMNSEELEVEISKQKKKIKTCQDTIKLLEKLQVAESTKQQAQKKDLAQTQNRGGPNGEYGEI